MPSLTQLSAVAAVVLAASAAAIAALLAAAYLVFRRSLPAIDGAIAVTGLGRPVEIIRDSDAVPHIYAKERRDAHFGLGYVHAQDRLWQMEYQRRLASGTLAEVFGSRAVKADVAMRTLGLRRSAEQALEHLSAHAREPIDSYVKGVNEAIRRQSGFCRPPECLFLRVTTPPWTAVDVLTCGKLMAWNLAGTYTGDLLRTDMQAKLGAERTSHLMSFADDLPREPSRAAEPVLPAEPSASLSTMLEARGSEGVGSNQWTVDGTRTVTGKPVLATDPHLPTSIPGRWYLAHLSAPGLEVIGATVPGIPVVVSGRNRFIGWGVASLDVDVQDLFDEDPEEPVSSRQERIRVRGGVDVEAVVRATRHGPIVSEMIGRTGNGAPPPNLALRWTALEERDDTIAAFLRLNEAADWDEFCEALRPYVAPVLLFTYADVAGNIGCRMAGKLPVRSNCDGSLVVPARSGGEWTGWIPFEEMPACRNPATHAIVSANTREVPSDYPHFLGREHIERHRRERIWTLLHAKPRLTLKDHVTIQLDTLSTQAVKQLPLLLPWVWGTTPVEQAALDLLRSWDCDMRRESAAAAVFAAWWRELPKALAFRELGPTLFKSYELWPSYTDRFVRRCLQRLASVNGVEESADILSIRAAVQQSFTDAVTGVRQRLGPDPSRWRWDRLHRAVFAHTPFHRFRWLRRLCSRTIPTGGDWSSINVGGTWSYDRPFEQRYVAGYRQILDLSTPDRGLFIQAVGQSGHPLSPHYADMAARWQARGYCAMRMSRDAIERAKKGALCLYPEGTAGKQR